MSTPHLSDCRGGQEHAWPSGLPGAFLGHVITDMRPGNSANSIMNGVVGDAAPRREIAHRSAVSVLASQPAHVIFVQNSGAGLIRISWLGPTDRRWVVHPAPGGAVDRLRERPAAHTDHACEVIYRGPVSHLPPGVTHQLRREHPSAATTLPPRISGGRFRSTWRHANLSTLSTRAGQAALGPQQITLESNVRRGDPTAIRCTGRQRPRPAPPASVSYPRSAAPLAADASADASSLSGAGSVVPSHGLRQLAAVPQRLPERTAPATWSAIPCRLRDQSVARQPHPRTVHPWSRSPSPWSKALV